MADVLYVAIMIGFFALAAGFVAACDRIIGGDSPAGEPVETVEPAPVGADAVGAAHGAIQ